MCSTNKCSKNKSIIELESCQGVSQSSVRIRLADDRRVNSILAFQLLELDSKGTRGGLYLFLGVAAIIVPSTATATASATLLPVVSGTNSHAPNAMQRISTTNLPFLIQLFNLLLEYIAVYVIYFTLVTIQEICITYCTEV